MNFLKKLDWIAIPKGDMIVVKNVEDAASIAEVALKNTNLDAKVINNNTRVFAEAVKKLNTSHVVWEIGSGALIVCCVIAIGDLIQRVRTLENKNEADEWNKEFDKVINEETENE